MDDFGDVYCPPEWSDDQRVSVLFSPFRESRLVNPSGWESKLNFWTSTIVRRSMSEKTAVITPKELPRMFERKGKMPFCLGTVVETMIKNGSLEEISAVRHRTEQSWSSWTYDMLVKRPTVAAFNVFLKTPVLWTYSKLIGEDGNASENYTGIGDCCQGLSDKQYVVVDVVKHLAEDILRTYLGSLNDSNKNRLVAMKTLREICQKCCPCDVSFELALSWLTSENKCLIIEVDGHGKVVVFADLHKNTCQPPSDKEIMVFKLNRTTAELQKQIEMLEQEMESLRSEARLYLQKGMKASAKNCLRRKKRLENQRDKKEAAIENIHQLLCTLEQAEADKQVLDVYSSSVAAFKDMTKKQGLTVESVDDVMLGIQEVIDTQDELDRSIATSVLPGDVTSDDLERELSNILESPGVPASASQVDPHQDLINALCHMKVIEDDLPAVPEGTSQPSAPAAAPAAAAPAAAPAVLQ